MARIEYPRFPVSWPEKLPTYKEVKEKANRSQLILFFNWKDCSFDINDYHGDYKLASFDGLNKLYTKLSNCNYCPIVTFPFDKDMTSWLIHMSTNKIPIAASSDDLDKIKKLYSSSSLPIKDILLNDAITHYIVQTQDYNGIATEKPRITVSKEIRIAKQYNLTPIITVRTLDEATTDIIKDHEFKGLIVYEPNKINIQDIKNTSDQLKTFFPKAQILYSNKNLNLETARQLGIYGSIDGFTIKGMEKTDADLSNQIIDNLVTLKDANYLFDFFKYLQFRRESDGKGLDGQGASYIDVIEWLNKELKYHGSTLTEQKETLETILLEFKAAKNRKHPHTDATLASANMLYGLVQEQLEEIEKQEKG